MWSPETIETLDKLHESFGWDPSWEQTKMSLMGRDERIVELTALVAEMAEELEWFAHCEDDGGDDERWYPSTVWPHVARARVLLAKARVQT